MTEPTVERIEVERTIKADPAAIFAVLRDPDGHVSRTVARNAAA